MKRAEMTVAELALMRTEAIEVAGRMATKAFEKRARGRANVEIHIDWSTLRVLLAVAYEFGAQRAARRRDVSGHEGDGRVLKAVRVFIEDVVGAMADCNGGYANELTLPPEVYRLLLEDWCVKWSAEWRERPPESVEVDCCIVRPAGRT